MCTHVSNPTKFLSQCQPLLQLTLQSAHTTTALSFWTNTAVSFVMDVESKRHHCFYPSKYFCSCTNASMCMTLVFHFVCNICTCSILFLNHHVSFFFFKCFFFLFSFASQFPQEIYCCSYANLADIRVGQENVSPVIEETTEHCSHALRNGAPVLWMCSSSSYSLCKYFLYLILDQQTLSLLELMRCSITEGPSGLRCHILCSQQHSASNVAEFRRDMQQLARRLKER